MATFKKDKIETLKDYIYCLCYYRGVTIKQMCEDLNIPYASFKASITKSIGAKRLSKIIKYLDGNFALALDLPLTSDKNNSLPVLPSNILSPDEFKHIVFESRSERYMQFSRSVNHYTRQNNKSKPFLLILLQGLLLI